MSITLAIALTGLTSLAVALLLLPLLPWRRQAQSRDAYNLAVYRDQLGEIERDLGRGLLSSEQAATARAEIGRRILALDETEAPPRINPKPLAAAIIAVLALPVAALLIYAQLGSPSLPGQPFAERAADGVPKMSMEEALGKLRAHLKTHPDDLTGWLLLARSEVGVGRYREGADAYARAAALSSDRPDIAGAWGEAQVLAADGTVTAKAAQAFETALRDPASAPQSRYYLALAKLQHGDPRGALREWADLAAASPDSAEWQPLLRQRIAEVAKAEGIDPAPFLPSAATTGIASGAAPPAAAMPSQEAVKAAAEATAGASATERRAMIEAMVGRLAARLEQEPDDADGWARLGRSYLVLQQPAKARDAYARAVKLKPGDPALAQALAEATQQAAGGANPGATQASP
jgi:cytochrome c-type biogenesis protein CcmH